MSLIFESTHLWQSTLADQGQNDGNKAPRDRLRNTYISFRERVAHLAAEIHRHLPDYTVHDVTHLDALWEMADIIAGPDFTLTPTEGFVLGGAILLHDLGMGLASYPRGIAELREDISWADTVTAQYKTRFDRFPTPEEINEPSDNIKRVVVETLLRNLHAKHAEQLASVSWQIKGGAPQFLIEDNEIRQIFGRIIGLIAHSHWWAVSKVETEFTRPLGAPPWCPRDWVVDPLKIACLLRVADASHIDARRAPSFLRAVRRPSKFSDEHWKFQERLQKPYLSEDALAYTSGTAFSLEDASSWWLCLDTLKMIDKELRSVDALLSDKRLQRLSARRVVAVESPERLVQYIPTCDWMPVDAFFQVSDVPRLIRNLGGAELYGNDLTVPVRELIQNSADAIRARRLIDDLPSDWGEIHVRLSEDDKGEWLEVEDNGIGMSADVLTKYLLDFGSTYWQSNQMLEDFPGLLSKGFQPTGKYGIGFFSVFMLGSAIRITTRRADAGQDKTLVVEFNTGLSNRPIIRPAKPEERSKTGGTIVRVWFDNPTVAKEKLFSTRSREIIDLNLLCTKLAPAIDVNLTTSEKGIPVRSITAFDWITCDASTLFKRINPDYLDVYSDTYEIPENKNLISKLNKHLRLIRNEDGAIVGRGICTPRNLITGEGENWLPIGGIISTGGLKAQDISGFAGILLGNSIRAVRDKAIPLSSYKALKEWASEQVDLIPLLFESLEDQAYCASQLFPLTEKIVQLPLIKINDNWLKYDEIVRYPHIPDEVVLFNIENINVYSYRRSDFKLASNAIQFPMVGKLISYFRDYLSTDQSDELIPENRFKFQSIINMVLFALAERWNVSVVDLIKVNAENWNNKKKSFDAVININEIMNIDFSYGGFQNIVGTLNEEEEEDYSIKIRKPS